MNKDLSREQHVRLESRQRPSCKGSGLDRGSRLRDSPRIHHSPNDGNHRELGGTGRVVHPRLVPSLVTAPPTRSNCNPAM